MTEEQRVAQEARRLDAAAERLFRAIEGHPAGIQKGALIRTARCTNMVTGTVNEILATLQAEGAIER